ncbi:MAG: PAS domain-containing protein [Fibrobacteria bacterium]|nr:PAS domain-containing protein [Fibrobacteria bacterium]
MAPYNGNIEDFPGESGILFEKVPCYIAILDRDYKIVRSNEKLRNTFGSCRGRHCYDVYKKRSVVCEKCPTEMTFHDGQEHTSTHVGINKVGDETHYIVTTSPLMGENGNVDYVMEILTDITQIKSLEKDKLEAERLAAVGQTVAGLAHSVKNILMGVEGGMYMVEVGINKGDQSRTAEGWDMLQRNITKVSTLVKDFLSFAKGRKPVVKLIDPNVLLDDIVELYADTASKMGIELKKTRKKYMASAPLDPDAIHTCLTNLVSNAIDTCHISSKDKKIVILDAVEDGGNITISVSDNGSGIDYDIQKKIFTTFFTTKGGNGTGLGLLTTRKIVQEHGGKIEVESIPGKGSVFKIVLPRKQLPVMNDSP